MNFQEKLLEASATLRTRAAALAASAVDTACARVDLDARVQGLRKSISVLNGARLELRKVAGRHARRFVKQNSSIASAVGKDVSALARSTFDSLSTRAPARKPRRAAAAPKRTTKAA